MRPRGPVNAATPGRLRPTAQRRLRLGARLGELEGTLRRVQTAPGRPPAGRASRRLSVIWRCAARRRARALQAHWQWHPAPITESSDNDQGKAPVSCSSAERPCRQGAAGSNNFWLRNPHYPSKGNAIASAATAKEGGLHKRSGIERHTSLFGRRPPSDSVPGSRAGTRENSAIAGLTA